MGFLFKHPSLASLRSHDKFGSFISCNYRGNFFPEQLTYLMTVVRNHTPVENTITTKEKTKCPGETLKLVFWQTSINEQRPKFKIWVNKWHCHWSSARQRYICNNNFIGILAAKLASLGCKCSIFWNWNFISGKAKIEMHWMYRTWRTEKY